MFQGDEIRGEQKFMCTISGGICKQLCDSTKTIILDDQCAISSIALLEVSECLPEACIENSGHMIVLVQAAIAVKWPTPSKFGQHYWTATLRRVVSNDDSSCSTVMKLLQFCAYMSHDVQNQGQRNTQIWDSRIS
jgi:hypothetical protein